MIDTISLRPATPDDAGHMADLLAQLYRAEVPGALRGPVAGQVRLFQHLVFHELRGGGAGRYLAFDDSGLALGSASLRGPGNPADALLPPAILQTALAAIGPGDTLRLLLSALRASLTADVSLRADECYVYSVVVDAACRGRGVGAAMMGLLEEQARRMGARSALLRVVVGNQAARRLYMRLGYGLASRTPPILDWLTVPTELLRKEL